MDVGIVGTLIVLMLFVWLPVVVVLLLISYLAAALTYGISQGRISTNKLFSKYLKLAAVAFVPCEFWLVNISNPALSWDTSHIFVISIFAGFGSLLFWRLSRSFRQYSS